MRARTIFALALALFLPPLMSAQVTHGQKAKLPAPFLTKSAGNPPEVEKPPTGFLPTVPQGFVVNVFATNFKYPRWLTVAPNGDIFLADSGSGEVVVLRDPQPAGGGQEREGFVSDMKRPVGVAFRAAYGYLGKMKEPVSVRYGPKN